MAKTLTGWGRLARGLPLEDERAKVSGTRPAPTSTDERLAQLIAEPALPQATWLTSSPKYQSPKAFQDEFLCTPKPSAAPKIDRAEIRFRSMKAAIATDPELLGVAASRNIGDYAKQKNSWPCRRDGDVINDLTEVCHKANYLRTNDGWHSDYVRKIEDVVRLWDEGHHEALVAAMNKTSLSDEQKQAIEAERKARLHAEQEEKAERVRERDELLARQAEAAKLKLAEERQADLDNIVDVLEAAEVGGEW